MAYTGSEPFRVTAGGTGLSTLTAHSLMVGNGTSNVAFVGPTSTSGQILQSAGALANPAFSTATYPSTTTINQILYSSANNVVSQLAAANQSVLTTGVTGVPVLTSIATNGQLIIGSTAGAPAAATLTAGTGISIANGSNSITISASGGGMTWTNITGATQTIAVNNGYFANNASQVTFTLPASATIGDIFRIADMQGGFIIAQNANQQILFNASATTVGVTGQIINSGSGAAIELVATNTSASTVWRVISSSSNFIIV